MQRLLAQPDATIMRRNPTNTSYIRCIRYGELRQRKGHRQGSSLQVTMAWHTLPRMDSCACKQWTENPSFALKRHMMSFGMLGAPGCLQQRVC